jgi:hypothetical protein
MHGGVCDRLLGLPRWASTTCGIMRLTELTGSQASEAPIMAIASHVPRQTLEHYSHVRLDLKRKALVGLSARRSNDSTGKPSGYAVATSKIGNS